MGMPTCQAVPGAVVVGFKFELDVFGDVQFSREILRMGQRGHNMVPAFGPIADDFLKIERRQFDTQGGYASGGWKPLAASTLAEKRRNGFDLRILHRTLAMRNSLTKRGAAGSIRRMSADELVMGTNVRSAKGFPYPAAHQHGAGVPRRRPIELTEPDKKRWVKWLQQWLITGERPRA